MMKGSNSLEVVRNMKRMSLFTAVASLVFLVSLVITPGLLATIGPAVLFCFTVISSYLFLYAMKQHALWTANESRLLEEIPSSKPEEG